MGKSLIEDKSVLLEAISDARVRNSSWSRDELIALECSWGPSANPAEFIDGLIKNGDLVEFGVDGFGRVTYRAITKDQVPVA